MANPVRVLMLALVIALPVASSGCLADDIWREPFDWQGAVSLGENQDAAQALSAGLASLGGQTTGTLDEVVSDVGALPDSVFFENARDFLNGVQPGAGDTFNETVHVAVGSVEDSYVLLSGPLGAAVGQVTGPLLGTPAPVRFEVPDRTTRLRWTLDVVLTGQEAPEPGQNPTPIGAFAVRLYDPDGDLRAEYDVDTTRQIHDQLIEGTWGDRSEVRADLGGQWRVEVDANAEGAWSLVFESYSPELDDYKWWQFWRAERRVVSS